MEGKGWLPGKTLPLAPLLIRAAVLAGLSIGEGFFSLAMFVMEDETHALCGWGGACPAGYRNEANLQRGQGTGKPWVLLPLPGPYPGPPCA